MVNILHSFPSKEHKFKEYCQLTFNLDNINNTFVDELSNDINLKNYHIIVLHSLRFNDCLFLINNKIDIPVIWFFWGGEFFNDGKFYNYFILDKTKAVRRKIYFEYNLFRGIKQYIKESFPLIIDLSRANRVKLAAIKKLNIIVPVVKGDCDILKKRYKIKAECYHLNYVNPLVESEKFNNITGKNILLGNSATFSNNFFEAIDQLIQLNIDERKVIIPLSYGDKKLAEYVEKYALDKIGEEKTIILKEFMSYSDYNKILLTCEIVIMNHIRQQAVGNIVQSLINGSHVYLRRESSVYKYLIECKFKISAINDTKMLNGLTNEEIIYNRNLAKKIFGSEIQHKKLKNLIAKVTNE